MKNDEENNNDELYKQEKYHLRYLLLSQIDRFAKIPNFQR